MSRLPRLASLFAAALAAPSGCTLLFGPCDGSDRESTVTVPAAALAEALADGALGIDECEKLCRGDADSSGTGAPTTSATDTGTGSSFGSSGSGTGETESTGGSGSETGGTDGPGTATESTGETGGTGGSGTATESTGETGGTGGSGTETGGTGGAARRGESHESRRARVEPVAYEGELKRCQAVAGSATEVVCVYAGEDCSSGRRPAGLRSCAAEVADEPGAWLAATAHLEAASVTAFERLADELREHGAPAALQVAALAAAEDERRHAQAMTAQARRFGAEVVAVAVAPATPRSLFALACENAVEGCVRETWAALLALHQAQVAADPEVQAMMIVIADEERRHAELAWAIDAWARTRLCEAEVDELDRARLAAAVRLRPTGEPPEALAERLGLPRLGRAAPMWQTLAAALWAA